MACFFHAPANRHSVMEFIPPAMRVLQSTTRAETLCDIDTALIDTPPILPELAQRSILTLIKACFYDIDSDHRRKGALKRDIAQLKDDLGPRNAILEAIRKGSEADVDDIVQLIRSNPDDTWDSIAEGVKKISISALQKTAPSSYLEGELQDFAIKTSTKLGNIRQYGHTSNLYLLENDDETANLGRMYYGNWTNVTNNHEFIRHLLDVYLSWGHPMYTLFSEEIFLHGMQDRKLKYCTPLLVNAILAIACHFSDRREARANPNDPSSIGDHFFAEAVRLLHEDGRPSLTTVQALGIMSLHQAMNNQDSSGWSYLCQTMGMVMELGLHKDQPVPTNANDKFTDSEVAARRITFWGCYYLQTAWAVCVGRLSLVPWTAIRMDKPVILDHLERKPWRPYGTAAMSSGNNRLEQPGLRYTLLLHLSHLCEIVDDIVQMFYAPRDRITSRRLQLHHEKLQAWYKGLPYNLAIKENSPTLPHVITLHVYYHTCVIQLFRPFIRVSFVNSTKNPRQICGEAAIRISEAMALYKATYGFSKMCFIFTHCCMTAAIIHLVRVTGANLAPHVMDVTSKYVADAIRALYDMLQSFPIVERYLKAIRALVLKWFAFKDIPPSIMEAMMETDIGSPSSTHSNVPPVMAQAYQTMPDRKSSAPDLFSEPYAQQPEHPNPNMMSAQTFNQQIYWTPFPNQADGLPLALPVDNNPISQLMDITSMLDSGIDGDWPQLNRDGFTMSGEDEVAFWDVSWDNPVLH
ncbi:hypothetical protein HYALB_00012447 [Hymenoscyphus albidus]|uniref:Xylanolytic transcriptional activator regulatory domain-containing protein n=1 Tax=Hymenoscyphus albidus TaxID=595503 RepID=A0A9N9LQF1_9HELO|nr:hypothetical protein HYALB_00012447 [Hymenoscyphus albidus]